MELRLRALNVMRVIVSITAMRGCHFSKNEGILFFASVTAASAFLLLSIFLNGFFRPLENTPSDGYLPLAQNIYELGAFTYSLSEPFVPETSHVPGYPLFLAYTAVPFGNALPAFVAQALLFALSAVFLYRLVSGFLPSRVAFWGALLYGIEPFTSFIVVSALSEALFLFLFVGGLLSLRRTYEHSSYSFALLAGLLLSFAVLVRPIALFVAPLILLLALVLLYRKRNVFLPLCAGLLMFVLPLASWTARNHDVYGLWSLSTKGPFTVYFWDVGQLVEYREGLSAKETEAYLLNRLRATHPELREKNELRHPRYAATLKEESIAILRESPFLYAKLHIMSMGTFFLSDGYRLLLSELRVPLPPLPNITKSLAGGDVREALGHFLQSPLALVSFIFGFIFWAVSTALAFLAVLFVWWRREPWARRFLVTFFFLLMFAFAALTGPVAQARYRIVATPFIFILAAYSAHVLSRRHIEGSIPTP